MCGGRGGSNLGSAGPGIEEQHKCGDAGMPAQAEFTPQPAKRPHSDPRDCGCRCCCAPLVSVGALSRPRPRSRFLSRCIAAAFCATLSASTPCMRALFPTCSLLHPIPLSPLNCHPPFPSLSPCLLRLSLSPPILVQAPSTLLCRCFPSAIRTCDPNSSLLSFRVFHAGEENRELYFGRLTGLGA